MKKKYYIPYVFFSKYDTLGFGECLCRFKFDKPSLSEIEEIKDRLKEEHGCKGVVLLNFTETADYENENESETEYEQTEGERE